MKATLPQCLQRITAKLREARLAKCQPFGFESHKFRCKPKLTKEKVAHFERRFRIKLPPDYRAFLTQVASGGAGPGFGLISLASALPKTLMQTPTDFLRTPFRHRRPYSFELDPKVERFLDRYEEGKVTAEAVEHWEQYQTAGALELCDVGCGIGHLLVITGPTRGKVWIDDRCNTETLAPLKVTFLDWYERWLNNTLAGGDGCWWIDADFQSE